MRRHLLPLGTALALLTACTGDPAPAPPPATTATTVPTTTTPTIETAPPITRTLDITPYADKTCRVLTNAQWTSLGFPTRASERRHGCRQEGPAPPSLAVLSLDIDYEPDSWAGQIESERTMVAGQPAAVHPVGRIGCWVIVWTTETQGFEINMVPTNQAPSDDWCQRSVAMAEQIIRNLGG